MKHFYLITTIVVATTLVLSGCGSTAPLTQSVRFGQFSFDISDSYGIVSTTTGSNISYRSDADDTSSLLQLAQARVDSGVTIDQMASLNLQKLEVSLPGYAFVEQSNRTIDCVGDHAGEVVSFITQQGDDKLFHSQYYTIIEGQGYVWSLSSTKDNTRKILADMVKSATCE